MADRDERDTLHMRDVATRIVIPAGFTTFERGSCSDVTDLVGCWTTTRTPDELAPAFTAALTRAAGRSANSKCETLPYGLKSRSCFISFRDADHDVMISIDSDTHLVDGPAALTGGSRVRIDAN